MANKVPTPEAPIQELAEIIPQIASPNKELHGRELHKPTSSKCGLQGSTSSPFIAPFLRDLDYGSNKLGEVDSDRVRPY